MTRNDRQQQHQANERTFLAWLRTAIALIGFGLAIARFGLFLRNLQAAVTQQQVHVHAFLRSEFLGTCLVMTGIVVIALSVWSYHQTYLQIEQGNYRPNLILIWVVAGIIIILALLAIPFVL